MKNLKFIVRCLFFSATLTVYLIAIMLFIGGILAFPEERLKMIMLLGLFLALYLLNWVLTDN